MARYQTVDEYMAQLPDARRAVMEELRRTIAAAAPGATEAISYNMPDHRGQAARGQRRSRSLSFASIVVDDQAT